jgi:hypothetical protein
MRYFFRKFGTWEATKAGVYNGKRCICMRHPQERNCENWREQSQLIASAPTMLEALADIVREIDGSNDGKGAQLPICLTIRELAMTAFKEATGE